MEAARGGAMSAENDDTRRGDWSQRAAKVVVGNERRTQHGDRSFEVEWGVESQALGDVLGDGTSHAPRAGVNSAAPARHSSGSCRQIARPPSRRRISSAPSPATLRYRQLILQCAPSQPRPRPKQQHLLRRKTPAPARRKSYFNAAALTAPKPCSRAVVWAAPCVTESAAMIFLRAPPVPSGSLQTPFRPRGVGGRRLALSDGKVSPLPGRHALIGYG